MFDRAFGPSRHTVQRHRGVGRISQFRENQVLFRNVRGKVLAGTRETAFDPTRPPMSAVGQQDDF